MLWETGHGGMWPAGGSREHSCHKPMRPEPPGILDTPTQELISDWLIPDAVIGRLNSGDHFYEEI